MALVAYAVAATDRSSVLTQAPLITTAPELRAADASIIGYYPFPDDRTGPSWGTASCPSGYTFATADDGYGACCNSPDCIYATACAGADFFGPGGAGGTCGKGNTCISYTVKWATDSPTTAFWLGCSVPPNPSVPETLYRSTWQLSTSTSTRTSPRPTTTSPFDAGDDDDDDDFTLPPGFTMPTIPPPPTGLPVDWTLTDFSLNFPGQTGGPFLGDDGPINGSVGVERC
ncbi:uncharacterized protein B0I36DRAFT_389208 [Microdochium trichocladiopsis]|uniref:Uncharacterized protein n=1 Tax=Microdochium trichocladiopsis TaxID=1682393 RepID=A0A9P8XTV8_9PEZI|nr:uncharacterized protein B0I36DRAFT_389208 [Microdochium trichocladiopsis]KAH7014254.1 hypothetical protein B0I36DRAFT_389208 [Microdochium trichocladiopsis]